VTELKRILPRSLQSELDALFGTCRHGRRMRGLGLGKEGEAKSNKRTRTRDDLEKERLRERFILKFFMQVFSRKSPHGRSATEQSDSCGCKL